MKTIIYLVRHAEVENPNNIIYGRLEGFGLSEKGKKQAEKLAKYFTDKNISCIYSSPLLRAKQTAEIISNGEIPISYTQSLSEIDYKKWEGLRASQRDKAEVQTYIDEPTKLNLGETLSSCQKRMTNMIEKIVENNKGKKIIVISHADPIICTRLYYDGFKSLDLINKTITKKASITSLEFNEGLKCRKVTYKEIVRAKKDYP